MTTYFEIPLDPNPQTFQVTLQGVQYTFTVKFNTVLNTWILDIGDDTGNPIVSGISMVTGCDLLSQYRYLPVPPGQLVMGWTATGPVQAPDFTNLGTDGRLYYLPQ